MQYGNQEGSVYLRRRNFILQHMRSTLLQSDRTGRKFLLPRHRCVCSRGKYLSAEMLPYSLLTRSFPSLDAETIFVLIFSTNNPEIESGWWRLLILFAVSGFIGIYVLVYLFAYIVHQPHTERGRYKDTSTIIVPGPLSKIVTFFWGFQNYHSIHHLFPSVPFYRYRQLFSNIAEIMDVMEAPVYRLTSRGLIKTKAVEVRENR